MLKSALHRFVGLRGAAAGLFVALFALLALGGGLLPGTPVAPYGAVAKAAPHAGGVPQPAHVVVVVEENHAYSQIIGAPAAPYINALAQQGALFTNSFAVEHPSQPNYLDLFSGLNQGVIGDNCPNTYSAVNLGNELISGGWTFSGYSEDLPAVGSPVCTAGAYARKHSPWINFTNVPTTTHQPFANFPSDYSTLPTLSFIIPNLNDDMHDGTIQQGDTWLQQHVSAYAQWAMSHQSLLIVTWDEDDDLNANHIATIFAGPMVVPGQYGDLIGHYRVLRTLEDMYNLPYAGLSGAAAPITDVWASGLGTATAGPSGTATPAGTAGATRTAGPATASATSTPLPLLSTPTATGTPGCQGASVAIAGPNSGTSLNYLYGVAARAVNDIWAVGTFYDKAGSAPQTLTLHGDGSGWTVVPSPNNSGDNNILRAVAAPSANDAWTVGSYRNAGGLAQTLALHWDGSAWTAVGTPNRGAGDNRLSGIAAVAGNDIWAVGSAANAGGVPQTLIEHWDGSAWTLVVSPNSGSGLNLLHGIGARVANDLWAVGVAAGSAGLGQTLILHWDGSTWALVASPNNGTGNNILQGVTAIGSADAWAAGTFTNSSGIVQTLILHWDGNTWTLVPSPNSGAGSNTLQGISATASHDIWAAGFYANSSGIAQTLALHWDGSQWSQVATPNYGTHDNYLYGVSARSGADVWSAGFYADDGAVSQTLGLHYTSACATGTPTPIPSSPTTTRTPLPTQTPGGPTATAPPSGTPCTAQFSDVHPADYFYTPVLYLACHGAISGYGDGTYRPYNQTTRAQMVKIVILGFQKTISTPPGGDHTFADVPAGFPFFAVIERAAAEHIVSGYSCGGAGEPCDPAGRPYFRPYANVTRGQLSKIDVLTAGWPLQTPASGTFADVAPGSAFYPFVETAACHGIISGYACGGLGEPCDPAGRPYFRPSTPATRGQIAKIVYLSLTGNAPCPGPLMTR